MVPEGIQSHDAEARRQVCRKFSITKTRRRHCTHSGQWCGRATRDRGEMGENEEHYFRQQHYFMRGRISLPMSFDAKWFHTLIGIGRCLFRGEQNGLMFWQGALLRLVVKCREIKYARRGEQKRCEEAERRAMSCRIQLGNFFRRDNNVTRIQT